MDAIMLIIGITFIGMGITSHFMNTQVERERSIIPIVVTAVGFTMVVAAAIVAFVPAMGTEAFERFLYAD